MEGIDSGYCKKIQEAIFLRPVASATNLRESWIVAAVIHYNVSFLKKHASRAFIYIVKTRRVIFHAFLSLLLLVSQQIGFAHVISHWSDVSHVAGQLTGQPSGAQAQVARPRTTLGAKPASKQSPVQLLADQSCEQCLSFAQIGSALGTDAYSFPLGSIDRAVLVASATPFAHLRTIVVFQSRAPPALT
jgi:hypothetical protein